MAAREGTPGLGVLALNTCGLDEDKKPRLWRVGVGYRYQPSFRNYVGTVEQKQREVLGRQIENIYHLMDFSIERQLTARWSVAASLPLLFAHWNRLYNPHGRFVVNGVGDASIGGRAWIFKPPKESGENVSIGAFLKLPTGKCNATGRATAANGQPIIAAADQSIQAGDGGTGVSLELQAFKSIPWRSEVYFTGTYLFNPGNTNGVSPIRRARGETVMSVTDQYLYRGGGGAEPQEECW